MNDFLDLLSYPFVQRALIAGVLVAILYAMLGVFVVARRMAFFTDGIAHASLAGIAIAILVGVAPLPAAIMWAVAVAIGMFLLERHAKLSSDTAIGILFTASMALGVVFLSLKPGYQPELVSFLFGNILTLTTNGLIALASFTILTIMWMSLAKRALLYSSLDEDSARISGIKTWAHILILYIALAVAIVLGVKMLGVVLVSALLIIPPATGSQLSKSFSGFCVSTFFASLMSISLGLFISFFFNIPSGATIILTATMLFCVSVGVKIIKR